MKGPLATICHCLSFLLVIGVSLIVGGLEVHIPEGYFYFSMAFALLVNIFQMKVGKRKLKPVKAHEHYLRDEAGYTKDVVIRKIAVQRKTKTLKNEKLDTGKHHIIAIAGNARVAIDLDILSLSC